MTLPSVSEACEEVWAPCSRACDFPAGNAVRSAGSTHASSSQVETRHVLTFNFLGSNPGCGEAGFSCAKGWDPVTGLGTPNYPAMLDLFMGLD